MIRRTKKSIFMDVAVVLSLLGTCDRKQVGAMFIRDGRCVTWGYNGAAPGMPHCDENMHGWEEDAAEQVYERERTGVLNTDEHLIRSRADELTTMNGCKNATHAEANALAFAARHGIATEGTTLFVTVSPCLDCARLLIAAGVTAVFYREEYRDGAGFRLLADAGIQCRAL